MKTSGIYGIFNIVNGKVLVGSSSKVRTRLKQHKLLAKRNKHLNPHFQSAWNKYGKMSFEFRILELCPENMLIQREDAWMEYYNSTHNCFGYNMQNASRTFISEEIRKNMSKAGKGKIITPEWRKHMSEGQRGKVHLSEKAKKKLSEMRKGKLNPFYGRKHTKETITKCTFIAAKNPMYGKHHTKESIQKILDKMTPKRRKQMSDLKRNWWKKKHEFQLLPFKQEIA